MRVGRSGHEDDAVGSGGGSQRESSQEGGGSAVFGGHRLVQLASTQDAEKDALDRPSSIDHLPLSNSYTSPAPSFPSWMAVTSSFCRLNFPSIRPSSFACASSSVKADHELRAKQQRDNGRTFVREGEGLGRCMDVVDEHGG